MGPKWPGNSLAWVKNAHFSIGKIGLILIQPPGSLLPKKEFYAESQLCSTRNLLSEPP